MEDTVAIDCFLKIATIEGESKDHKHRNEIDVLSFSWGEKQTGSFGFGGGGGAGKISMEDFQFVMKSNKATPKLFLACATGEHLASAVLTCRKAGKEQQEYLKFKFTDLLVSSYRAVGSTTNDELPLDQITLNYAKVEIEYREQAADGSLAGPIKAWFDAKTLTHG